jgi:hypothetical protein
MRRAISFFFISIMLFLISLFFARDSLKAGIFSITLAFFYVVFPVGSTKILSLIIVVPLGLLYGSLGLLGSSIILSICILELLLPYVLGYFLIVLAYKYFGPIVSIIITILFITLWFILRKHQWRLCKETWKRFDFYWNSIRNILMLMENILEGAGKIGASIIKG